MGIVRMQHEHRYMKYSNQKGHHTKPLANLQVSFNGSPPQQPLFMSSCRGSLSLMSINGFSIFNLIANSLLSIALPTSSILSRAYCFIYCVTSLQILKYPYASFIVFQGWYFKSLPHLWCLSMLSFSLLLPSLLSIALPTSSILACGLSYLLWYQFASPQISLLAWFLHIDSTSIIATSFVTINV